MYANRKDSCALFCVITFFLADDELIVLVLVQVAAFMVSRSNDLDRRRVQRRKENFLSLEVIMRFIISR